MDSKCVTHITNGLCIDENSFVFLSPTKAQ